MQSEKDELYHKLSEEQASKKQITLLLLEDRKKMATLYLEEKKRSEDLSHLLREEKTKVHSLGIGLEEESKRSLAMEAELERYLLQINSQGDELSGMRVLHKDLEDALRRARGDAEHFKKQLTEAHRVAMSQASVAASVAAVVNNPQAFAETSTTTADTTSGSSSATTASSVGIYNKGSGYSSIDSKFAWLEAGQNISFVSSIFSVKSATMPSTYERDSHSKVQVLKTLPKLVNDYQASSGTMIPRQHRSGVLNSKPTTQGGGPGHIMDGGNLSTSSSQSSLNSSSSTMSNLSSASSGKVGNSPGDPSSNASSRLINLSASSSSTSSSSVSTTTAAAGGAKHVIGSSKAVNKASVSLTSSSSSLLGKGVPPPVPPNKPAMSALYKPLTAALKLGTGAGNDNGVTATGIGTDNKTN